MHPDQREPIVSALSTMVSKVMNDAALHEQLARLGIQPTTNSSPAMATAYVKAEMAKWKPVVDVELNQGSGSASVHC